MRRCVRIWIAALFVGCAAIAAAGEAEAAGKKLALIVGNNGYQEVPALSTAVNDAQASMATLTRLGFTVEIVENGTKRQISRAIARVEGLIEPGDSVVFHFAGHGFEIDGQNWLLPVDVPAAKQGEAGLVKDESFNAADVIERFRARGAGTVVAILDACRDNPFAQQGGTRAIGGTRGLARMDASGGVFILFSAGAKQQALDRLSDSDPVKTSIFARVFLPLLTDGSMTLIDLAKETQLRVRNLARTVGHEQIPAYYDGVVGRISLTGEVATESAQPKMQAPSAAPAVSAEDRFWRSVETKDDRGSYEAYLQEVARGTFPGTYRRLAELRLAALSKGAPGGPAAPSAPGQVAVVAPGRSLPVSPEMEACDRAAASPDDPDKPANVPGIEFKSITGPAAVAACRKAMAQDGVPRRVYFQLGRAYVKLNALVEAVEMYKKGADLKHPSALHNLAILYVQGNGVKRDYGAARVMFEMAGAGGVARSYHEIGALYGGGKGGPVDYVKARLYYEKAIAMGEAQSYANLGNLYFYGHGVPRDRDMACRTYGKGAAAGDPVAISNLRRNCRA